MDQIKTIKIQDFDYKLPEERIALYPKKSRQESNLLKFDGERITDHSFTDVPNLLDENDLLVFNNTRVLNARLWFKKTTGKVIEIFILEPSQLEMTQALSSTERVTWNCFVGGAKKWKDVDLHQTLEIGDRSVTCSVHKGERIDNYFQIEFYWNDPNVSFSEILESAGRIPLPPYIHREVEEEDKERYQTVYNQIEGSVAAPTAGLHFTEKIIKKCEEKGVQIGKLTLHVGAGTFKPVQSEEIGAHDMHDEYFEVSRALLTYLIEYSDRRLIAVGTTSVRTLESLYWAGVQAISKEDVQAPIHVSQWDPYQSKIDLPGAKEALTALLALMDRHKLTTLFGSTQLMIAPGYEYRIVDGIFTNFHMPKSTLLLLVSALVGDDWKKIYTHALENAYRFLSYGDSSLLFKKKHPQD